LWFIHRKLYSSYNKLDDDVCFVLNQNAGLDFWTVSSLEQQSKCTHVTTLTHNPNFKSVCSHPSLPICVGCLLEVFYDLNQVAEEDELDKNAVKPTDKQDVIVTVS
jgi:hypothetical protein